MLHMDATKSGLNVSTGHIRQKIELCPTKAALQRTELFGVKSKKLFTCYRRLKSLKYSVSIDLSALLFFYEHFNRQCSFLYIHNCKMCLSKKTLY